MFGNGAAGASYGDLLVTSLIVLGGVCVAAFVTVRLVGRFFATRSRGAEVMAVVARLPLEPRRSLFVVEVAGKTLLVGTSETGLSLISELDAAAVHARAVVRPSFGELVRGALLRRRVSRPASEAGEHIDEQALREGGAVTRSDEVDQRRAAASVGRSEPIATDRIASGESVLDVDTRVREAR